MQDTVCVTGPHCQINSPLVVPEVTFGQANQMAAFFAQTPLDGILGLGFQSLAEDGVTPVFNVMVDQGIVPAAQFQIFLDSKIGTTDAAIVFGGYDQQYFTGDLFWVPLQSENYYVIRIDGVAVGGNDLNQCDLGCNAIVDSGTSLLVGPSQVCLYFFTFFLFSTHLLDSTSKMSSTPSVLFRATAPTTTTSPT